MESKDQFRSAVATPYSKRTLYGIGRGHSGSELVLAFHIPYQILRQSYPSPISNIYLGKSSAKYSALGDVERSESAKRRFFVTGLHVFPRLIHRFDHLIERDLVCSSLSRIAIRPALIASTAPTAFRSIHGICTKLPVGSQVIPKSSIPISAAYSTCCFVPPRAAVSPPAAIEHATPTSPWQPTSAPEIEAFPLYKMPIAAAVRKNQNSPSFEAFSMNFSHWCVTAGITPAGPFVGAVTTRPPAAFSSFTAIANTFTQSMAFSGAFAPSRSMPFARLRALRRTALFMGNP